MKRLWANLRLEQRPFFMEGLLLMVTLAWGLSFIWIKQITMTGMGANLLIIIRYSIAVALMTPFCIGELRRITRAELGYGCLIGVLMYLAMSFQTYGLMYTTPANSGFITAAYVAFVPFTAWAVLGQKPGLRVYLSAGLCVAGLWVINMGGESLEANMGNLLTLVCALAWSIQVCVVTKAARKGSIKVLTLVPMLVMLVISAVLGLATGGLSTEGVDMAAAMPPIVLCALFPTLLAGLAQTYAQRHIEPNKAAVIYTLESVFACIISVAMGLDQPTAALLVGGGLVVSAILLGEVKWPPAGRRAREKEEKLER